MQTKNLLSGSSFSKFESLILEKWKILSLSSTWVGINQTSEGII